jgi:hypothetical protein
MHAGATGVAGNEANEKLVRAIVDNDHAGVEEALECGASAQYENWFPLISAAWERADVFERLLAGNAGFVPERVLWNCAANALQKDNFATFRHLLMPRAEGQVPLLDISSPEGRNLVAWVMISDSVAALVEIERAGWKWPAIDPEGDSTEMFGLLLYAVSPQRGSARVLEHLCKSGLIGPGRLGSLVIRHAAWWGDAALLKAAQEAGAPSDGSNSEALLHALTCGHLECARLLIARGANVEVARRHVSCTGERRAKFEDSCKRLNLAIRSGA